MRINLFGNLRITCLLGGTAASASTERF